MSAPSRSPFRDLPALTPAGALARQLGSYAVLAALVAVLARAAGVRLPPVRVAVTLPDLAYGLAGFFLYAAYNAGTAFLLRLFRQGRELREWLAQRNRTLFGKLPVWTLFLQAGLAGPREELIFRGWLQPLAGLWPTSVLFALLHFMPTRYRWWHPATWGMVALYFPVGAFVGWLYAWRANLLAPILVHALSDSIGLLLIAVSSKRLAGAISHPLPLTSAPVC